MKLEEKIRLFGHYIGCKVKSGDTTIVMQSIDGNLGCVTDVMGTSLPIEDCKLVLKDLKNISIKDAYKCAELANLPSALYRNWEIRLNNYGIPVFSFPNYECANYRNMIVFKEDNLTWLQVDYLRNVGYAIGLPKEIYTTDIYIG